MSYELRTCWVRRNFPHACSRMTSVAFLSVRNSRKTGCRISASLVHSVNFTSPTSLGISHVVALSYFTFWSKGLLVGAQGPHRFIDRLQRRLVEAGADMPSIDPALIGLCRGPQALASQRTYATCAVSVTHDHRLLFMYRLELEPLARSLAREIEPCRALSDHVFFVRSPCLGELSLAELGDMLAVAQQRVVRQ